MATKITDRHCPVHFYDVIINSRAAKGYKVSSPSCSTISAVLQVVLGPKAKGSVLNPQAKVVMKSLDDIQPIANPSRGYALLFNCADLSKPDPRFKHFKTKTLRAAGKEPVEAVTKSCHALLIPDVTIPNKALLVMTMRSGTQSGDVAEFLNKRCLLESGNPKNSHIFAFKDPSGAKDKDGNFLEYRVNYKFEILAHKSQLLDEALRTGVFKEMTLIGHKHFGFDQGGNLEADHHTLTVKSISPTSLTYEKIKDSVIQHIRKTKEDFDQLRVAYKTSSGQDQSTTMQINHLDESFTRRENIVLDVNTPDCFNRLDKGIISSIQKLLTITEND